MRITADVEVTNRLLPSFNMRQKGRIGRSQLSVGKKPGSDGDVCLMLCTKQDKSGQMYKLKANIEQWFTKFLSEGKATIRFTEPPHDICISKADPVHLKAFLNIIRLGCQGKELGKACLSTLAPATSTQMNKLKTKLTITSKRDYPITTNFPQKLEVLSITGCSLKKVDARILQLRNLQKLDLSGNLLRVVPDSFGVVNQLCELHLADNQLEDIPASFCQLPMLQKCLKLLDLSRNKLTFLRAYVSDLQALVTLKLDKNQIVCLPGGIGRLQRLRTLTASNNKLNTLPVGFSLLRLDNLDLFDNQFLHDGPSAARLPSNWVPTLLECSARSVRNNRVAYTEDDVGFLMEYLSAGKKCLCGKFAFRNFAHCLQQLDLRTVTASFTGINMEGRSNVPVEVFLCSKACYMRFERNPCAVYW